MGVDGLWTSGLSGSLRSAERSSGLDGGDIARAGGALLLSGVGDGRSGPPERKGSSSASPAGLARLPQTRSPASALIPGR